MDLRKGWKHIVIGADGIQKASPPAVLTDTIT